MGDMCEPAACLPAEGVISASGCEWRGGEEGLAAGGRANERIRPGETSCIQTNGAHLLSQHSNI